MKTTIEIPDELSRQARDYARRHGLTLRELVERGLRSQIRAGAAGSEWEWKPIFSGVVGDPVPDRPPHELAYDDPT